MNAVLKRLLGKTQTAQSAEEIPASVDDGVDPAASGGDFFIVTRLGLGVARPEFFERALAIMRLTLAPSLRNQTDKRFTWVVATDCRAPAFVAGEIAAMAEGLSMSLWLRDPLVEGMNPISKKRLADAARGDDLLVARIDSDDLYARDFVASARRELQDAPYKTGLTFRKGLEFYPGEGLAKPVDYPWFSAGCVTKCHRNDIVTPYLSSHRKLPEAIRNTGGTVREPVGGLAMWARLVHGGSDSAAVRKRSGGRRERMIDLPLDQFGLSAADVARLGELAFVPPAQSVPPLFPDRRGYSRLEMKLAILSQVRVLRRRPKADPSILERLEQAFYDL